MAATYHDIVTSDDVAPHETHETAEVRRQLDTTTLDDNKALGSSDAAIDLAHGTDVRTTDNKPTIIEDPPTNGAYKGTPAHAEFKPILDLKHDENVPSSSDPESKRRASQVDWLKRESQIDPHDTSNASRERRPSKYPDNPFLGDINETATKHNKAKNWKLSDGDFGFGMPKKPSNAAAQGFSEPGFRKPSLAGSLEDAAPGPRGLFPNERRSIDKNVVSEHDKSRKWSIRDGDFGFGMPKRVSNASAQGFTEPGFRRTSIATGSGAEGPRGLADFEKGNIDKKVMTKHEKTGRKWSLADGDFKFGMPNKKSNAEEQGFSEPGFRRPSVAAVEH